MALQRQLIDKGYQVSLYLIGQLDDDNQITPAKDIDIKIWKQKLNTIKHQVVIESLIS